MADDSGRPRLQLRISETGLQGMAPPKPETPPSEPIPRHDARMLTAGGSFSQITLDGTAYILRITRNGKLILTK